jgi:hypothetical protein
MGARVIDAITGDELLLSNEHVFEKTGKIIQPGAVDGGGSGDSIGEVLRGSNLSPGAEFTIDAAVAKSEVALSPQVKDIGEIASAIPAAVGMEVWKSGRTTQLTKGVITDINAALEVNYDFGKIRLVDLIFFKGAEPTVMGGDSGSLLVTYYDGKPYAVGLVFAGPGNPPYTYGVACKIKNVMQQLGVVFPMATDTLPVQVRGIITDIETLQGIPGVYVLADGYSGYTDSEGNYQIGLADPGHYTIKVRATGYYGGDIEVDLVEGENNVSLALTPRGQSFTALLPLLIGATAGAVTITGVFTE